MDEARKAYQDAITLAADANDTEDECLAWIILGQALAGARDLHQAEDAYLQAYRIALLQKSAQLDTVRAMLMELEWFKGNPAESLRRLDLLLAATTPEQLGFAEYQLFYQRAEMLAALSREQEALEPTARPSRQRPDWRRGALPGEVPMQAAWS